MIKTERCVLELTSINDKKDLYTLYTDLKVWEYLGGPRNQERIKTGINSRIFPDKNSIYWTVRRNDTQMFLGNVSLTPHHNEIDIEISYEFLSSVWGYGYASEAVKAIIKYSFDNLNINKLVAETQEKNILSCKMLQKLGFQENESLIRFGAKQIVWCLNKHIS